MWNITFTKRWITIFCGASGSRKAVRLHYFYVGRFVIVSSCTLDIPVSFAEIVCSLGKSPGITTRYLTRKLCRATSPAVITSERVVVLTTYSVTGWYCGVIAANRALHCSPFSTIVTWALWAGLEASFDMGSLSRTWSLIWHGLSEQDLKPDLSIKPITLLFNVK